MSDSILVSEIFFTVQGEGALIGKPTVFVRTGGCDFRCSWCDTLYAVLPEHKNEWQPMSATKVLSEILRLSSNQPVLVTLSGGNPALAPLESLIDLGHEKGLTFALETQGSVARDWFCKLDHLVLSPKGPSSGMEFDARKLQDCIASAATETELSMKIVVFDELDYQFAREINQLAPNVSTYLQCGTVPGADVAQVRENVEWLLSRITEDGWLDVTLLPQLHVLLWGQTRGK